MKTKKTTELIKTALICVLLVSLVCLCAFYMMSFQGAGGADFTPEMLDDLMTNSTRYSYLKYFDSSYITPYFIGFSCDRLGTTIGFLYGDSTTDVYSDVSGFLLKLLGDGSHMTDLSKTDGQNMWNTAKKSDFIYIKYQCDVPKSLIYCFSSPGGIPDALSNESINEIFIVPDQKIKAETGAEIYSFFAVAKSTAGNYYKYTTDYIPASEEDLNFNTNIYDSYNKSGKAMGFYFASEISPGSFFTDIGFYDKISGTSAIPSDMASLPEIAVSSGFKTASDKKTIGSILKLFTLNPEKSALYTDEKGNLTYLAEGQNVKLGKNGICVYTATGASAGIPIVNLVKYLEYGGDYDIFDCVGATLVMLDSLKTIPGLIPDGFNLALSGVEYKDGVLSVSYGYTYSNLPVAFAGIHDALTFKIQDGVIKYAGCRFINAYAGITESVPDAVWTMKAYSLTNDTRCDFRIIYNFKEPDGTSNEMIIPGWKSCFAENY